MCHRVGRYPAFITVSRVYGRQKKEVAVLTSDESKTNLINVAWRMYTIYENIVPKFDPYSSLIQILQLTLFEDRCSFISNLLNS